MNFLIIAAAGLGALNLLGLLYVLRAFKKITSLYENWQLEVEEFAEDMAVLEDRQGELERMLEKDEDFNEPEDQVRVYRTQNNDRYYKKYLLNSFLKLDIPKDGKITPQKIHDFFDELTNRPGWKKDWPKKPDQD